VAHAATHAWATVSTRATTFVSTTFRATSRANIVHHVSNPSGERSKYRIGFCLSVLTRSNLFIEMCLELSNKSIGHFGDIDTLSCSNISK
jgi:hypothetical protein